jgi:hypothetical protein
MMLKPTISASLLLLAIAPCWSVCRGDEPSHKDEIAAFIATLRQEKDACESLVLQAKSDGKHWRDMNEGMRLYSEAMTEFNAAIAFVSTSVGLSPEAGFPRSMNDRFRHAMETASGFVEWYERPLIAERQNGPKAAAAIVGPLVVFAVEKAAEFILDYFKEQREKAEDRIALQRTVLRDELSRCLWTRWDQIGSNSPAPASYPLQCAPCYRLRRR